jgi:hypothetical protein
VPELSLRSRDGDALEGLPTAPVPNQVAGLLSPDIAALPRAHAGRVAVLVSLASNRISKLAHRSKSADGLLSRGAGGF